MPRFKTFALASSLALLAGCAATQAPVQPVTHLVTQTVKVEVPVLCVKTMPQPAEPFLTRDQLLTGSGYQVVMQYDREVDKHIAYEMKLTEALTGCLSAVPAPAPNP